MVLQNKFDDVVRKLLKEMKSVNGIDGGALECKYFAHRKAVVKDQNG